MRIPRFHLALLALLCPTALLVSPWTGTGAAADDHHFLQPAARVLFLGDDGHHQPFNRFEQLQPVLSERRIELDYTNDPHDINRSNLEGYDAILIYANITEIAPDQEQALLDFIRNGGGLVALHCASYCFHNSPKYIELVGAQFQRHGTGTFQETIVQPDHPVMQGLSPIESWDETYVHTKHNPDRTVLAERRDAEAAEPWTWVRTHGQGRVFYTAWGHDHRTWSHEGFHDLVENGIRWVSEDSPTRLQAKKGLPQFEYQEAPAPLPNYTPNAQWGTQGDPITTMQKPLDPAESMQHLVTFDEFDIDLYAAEPNIIKPLWLAWDQRGRLWIAESVDYPNNLQPEGEGNDRLKICEDTDGDARADTFTIFADELSIPTSFVFANGGVIVIHSGKTEFFQDTNGDDRADVRKVLFEGWGTRDTHATASNLRYGFDNWIWGTVGYSGFRGEVGGKEHRFGQGIFRFKPDGSELEFIRSSNNNTWGLGITEDNIIIGSTANGNASMYMPIPNRYYEAVNGWSASRLETVADSQRFYPITDFVRQVDWHGRYTAGSGSAIYTARDFPKLYWNRAQFVAEPTGHLLGRFFLERRGADFVAHNARNFLASDDEWTSPIYAEVGPDGALWVVDWYNYIIQHNPTPHGFETGKGNAYDTPLRDKTHGRIYRITHKEAQHETPSAQDSNSPRQLIQALKRDNLLWRLHAQRLLVSRGKTDVLPALIHLAKDTNVDEIGLNPGALHALWTMKGLGVLEGSHREAFKAATDALKHPSAGVRRAAVQVLPRNEAAARALLSQRLAQDPDAQVRLASLLALSEMPPSDAAASAILAAVEAPKNSEDRWILDAATSAAANNDAQFLRAVFSSYKPKTTASSTREAAEKNLIANGSFENETDGKPAAWNSVRYSGTGEFTMANTGFTGRRSVQISSERGGDLSWSTQVKVTPRTAYRLTSWIKTENVQARGNARGALLNIHELQDPEGGATAPLTGNNGWTQAQLEFHSGDMEQVTVNCLFGGWGRAAGTAWYDDVQLVAAPSSELPGEVGRVLRLVTTHYAQRGPVHTIIPTLLALENASPTLAVAVLDGLKSGWPAETPPPINPNEKEQLQALMKALPEAARDRLLSLSQQWGQASELFGASVATILENLKSKVTNTGAADGERTAAARRLMGLKDEPGTADLILEQVSLLSPPVLSTGMVEAIAESRREDTGDIILKHWSQFTPTVRRAAINLIMRRPDWALSLLESIREHDIPKTDLAPEHWSQLQQSPNRRVARWAERLAGSSVTISEDRQAVVDQLLPLANQKGDVERGREIYETSCAVCHIFNGQGGTVGPDLTGIGARAPSEVLIDIVDPNRSVEANYRMWNVTTKDGQTFAGRLEAETQTTVEILDTASQKHVIQRKDIESLEPSNLSIMPVGFEALPPEDIKALLSYLAQG